MRYGHLEQVLSKRSRILTHSLIISGTLNLALLATFVTLVLRERRGVMVPNAEIAPKVMVVHFKNEQVLKEFAMMDYDSLVKELYNEIHVEEGQRRCDLALAALARYHDFDVERSFSEYPMEVRSVTFGKESMTLYPGISRERLEGIRFFARSEVWPLTPKGLFKQIQKRETIPSSLKETFILTQEFFRIKKAFSRLPYAISDDMLFHLAIYGDWESVQAFSGDDLPSFLIPRMERGSKLAAYLLVLEEKDVALKFLNDGQMETLLAQLTEKTPAIEAFLEEVKGGVRSDRIKEIAGKPPENLPRSYTVQLGDSLWKISRMFDVKIDVIRKMNGLKSETLHSGMILILPPQALDPTLLDAKDGI